jgi:hypothetical protein
MLTSSQSRSSRDAAAQHRFGSPFHSWKPTLDPIFRSEAVVLIELRRGRNQRFDAIAWDCMRVRTSRPEELSDTLAAVPGAFALLVVVQAV